MSTEDIMSRLRGPKDSEVKLTIVRRGVDDQLYFTVKRDKIPILSLDASYMIQPKTGYIRINRFGATTAEEFAEALKSLQKKGMKDLILDLQGNGGGYLNAAIDLANEFLKQKNSSSTPKEGPHAAVISLPKVRATSRTAVSSYWWTSTPLLPVKS